MATAGGSGRRAQLGERAALAAVGVEVRRRPARPRRPARTPATRRRAASTRRCRGCAPLTIMCWRKTPSNVKPKRSAARRERALAALHFHSQPAVAEVVERVAGEQVDRLGRRGRALQRARRTRCGRSRCTPCAGSMRRKLTTPHGAPSPVTTARNSGSSDAACAQPARAAPRRRRTGRRAGSATAGRRRRPARRRTGPRRGGRVQRLEADAGAAQRLVPRGARGGEVGLLGPGHTRQPARRPPGVPGPIAGRRATPSPPRLSPRQPAPPAA